MNPASKSSGRLFGFIELADGVSRRNAFGALYASFFSIGVLNFTHFAKPFILLEIVGLDPDYIGRFTGYVATATEVLSVLMAIMVGIWADRYGRRILYVLAALLIAAGYLGLAFVQGKYDFIFYSMLMGMGSAVIGTMLGLIMVDYPDETSRGKWTGLNGVLNGLGIVTVALGVTKIPGLLESRGLVDTLAMQFTLAGLGVWCIVSALMFRFSLFVGPVSKMAGQTDSSLSMLRQGLAVGLSNPKVLLAYLCFVVSRSDLVVVATYFTLWVQDHARGTGVSPTEAVATAGMLFALIQGTALFWAPVFGYMLDMWNRVLCMSLALLIAGGSYVALGLSPDPLAKGVLAICVVVGMGQISVILATQSLIGQEAPLERRGVVVGIATFCGTIGLLATAFVGGILYDVWMPGAPLLIFGLINLLIMAVALLVWNGDRAVRGLSPAR